MSGLEVKEQHTRVFTKRFPEIHVREMLVKSVASEAGIDMRNEVTFKVEIVRGFWIVTLTERIGKEPDAEIAA
jgi:hypothetical protein